MTASCGTCRFRDVAVFDTPDEGGDFPHTICRRFPPTPVPLDDAITTGWPLVHEGDWCGEWEAG